MPDDFREIAAGLDVPLGWLVGAVLLGFIALVTAVTTRSIAACAISGLVGVAIAGAGLRAVLRSTRPLHLSPTSAGSVRHNFATAGRLLRPRWPCG